MKKKSGKCILERSFWYLLTYVCKYILTCLKFPPFGLIQLKRPDGCHWLKLRFFEKTSRANRKSVIYFKAKGILPNYVIFQALDDGKWAAIRGRRWKCPIVYAFRAPLNINSVCLLEIDRKEKVSARYELVSSKLRCANKKNASRTYRTLPLILTTIMAVMAGMAGLETNHS